MAEKHLFPSKDADFSTHINIVIPYLNTTTNKTRLVFTPTALAKLAEVSGYLNSPTTGWNVLYPQSQNPAVRTQTITSNKNETRELIEDDLRDIFDDIPKSLLTKTDRDTLGLAAPSSSNTPVAVPTSKPMGKVNNGQHLQHTISFVDADTPTSRAKPEGVRGCQIWYKIGDPAPTDAKPLTFAATDTKSPYVLHFEGEDAGKPVYYWLRWENTRGEVGPWSDAIKATISA